MACCRRSRAGDFERLGGVPCLSGLSLRAMSVTDDRLRVYFESVLRRKALGGDTKWVTTKKDDRRTISHDLPRRFESRLEILSSVGLNRIGVIPRTSTLIVSNGGL